MKKIKLLKTCALVTPIVGSVSIATSCHQNEQTITPTINYTKGEAIVSCTTIKLYQSFVITADPAEDYVIKSVTVKINEQAVTTTQSGNKWTVDGSVVTDKNIVIDVVTEQAPTIDTAQTYIKNRTFGIAGLDNSGQWLICGTCWVLSDATPNVLDDYNYFIATNWHVKYGIDDEYKRYVKSVGFHDEDMGYDVYQSFKSIEWKNKTDFCFNSSVDSAIDFYIAKVNFADNESALPTSVATKLNKLNAKQTKSGYINKYVISTETDNYTKNTLYCGGYPAKKRLASAGYTKTQMWRFETVAANSNVNWREKDHKYMGSSKHAGHSIDDNDTIWDVAPNYSYDEYFECTYDDYMEAWMPNNWSLTGGASGSMMITKLNNEWVVVGIYWGGWTSVDYESKHYFSPAWSIFKSGDKNFIANYE